MELLSTDQVAKYLSLSITAVLALCAFPVAYLVRTYEVMALTVVLYASIGLAGVSVFLVVWLFVLAFTSSNSRLAYLPLIPGWREQS